MAMNKPVTYRVGKRSGQTLWQIKESPFWKVVYASADFQEAVQWLGKHGVDLRLVPVLAGWPWKTVGQYVAEGTEPGVTPPPLNPEP
jgi:hypothetical protein